MNTGSDLNGLSQTGQMAWQAFSNQNVFYEDFDYNDEKGFFKENYYHDSCVGWLTLMGAQSYLIDETSLGGTIDGVEYPLVKLEISNTSHPFYTGKMKIVDTAGRVDMFYQRYKSRRK